ncbi:MerR family transcriptional regulator [Actinomyces ruminicola]|uniref:MerR family transcriptional regulator n=1 Tax=Actinomyces ruminicola TaxID=332524 RepID=UPI0011CAEB38|nr:MerR family transcriptional regulator [Actinomyces ruminicola]
MSAPAAVAQQVYTIGEAARETGLTTSALRFYDREGLIPSVARTGGGSRRFTEDDLEWIRYVERLKRSGMPIKEIREYVRLYFEGDSTIEARRRMVQARRREVLRELEELQTTLDYKCWFYEVAAAAGSCDAPRTMPLDQLPPRIRRIKEACGIHRY